MKVRLYLLITTFLFRLVVLAQTDAPVNFTTANGLPDNNVTCMLTDKQGFIWLGTLNGLCRFDGTHFYNFPRGVIQSNKIAGDIILDLEEDGDDIWVAHRFGVSRVNKYTFTCTNFQNDDAGPVYIHRRSIRDIYKDATGNIWLAGDHQLLRVNKKSNSLTTLIDFEKYIVSPDKGAQISKIIPAGENHLLLFIAGGWLKYDILKNSVDTQLLASIPLKLLKGENLRIKSYWNTFLSNQVVEYDVETKSLVFSRNKKQGAVGGVINLYVDSSLHVQVNQEQSLLTALSDTLIPGQQIGDNLLNVWKQAFNFIQYSNGISCWGSVRGLYVTDKRLKYLRRYFLKNNREGVSATIPDILDVKEYSATSWLVSTKSGLYLLDKTTSNISSFGRWKDSSIYKSLILPDKSVWLSTGKNLWHFNPEDRSTGKPIALESYAVSITHFRNSLIVGTRSHGFVFVDLNNLSTKRIKTTDGKGQISSNRVTSVKPIDTAGNFIISYNDPPGLFSYANFETGSYTLDSIPLKAYSFKEKFALESTLPAKNQLWIGSYLGGVYLYDSLSGNWKNLTTNDGLANNTVSEIIRDNQNRVWLLNYSGIDVYDNVSQQVYNFPLKFLTGGRKGGFINSSGKIIFYDNESIAEISPDDFELKTAGRSIQIAQVSQGDIFFSLKDYSLSLPYNNNSFTISFSLQKLDPSIQTRYSFRLSKNDDWKDIGMETELNFASLASGKYNLQIRATDEFGKWKYYSVPFPIIISVPLWKTWWFLLLVFLISVAICWQIIARRQKIKLRKAQQENEIIKLKATQLSILSNERDRITADLHDDVGATLSSMHIYGDLAKNVWNTQPNESKKMIDKISATSKDLMNRMGDIIWSMKPADEEKYSFKVRLKNYSTELLSPKNILADFEIDEELAAGINSPEVRKNLLLIAKEAINNVAKYSGASKTTISFKKQNDMIQLSISDNGKGFDMAAIQKGNGLQNIQQRCKQLNGIITINTAPGQGVGIHCRFPIATISHSQGKSIG